MLDRWLLYAILSAIAASLVAIFAKLGMEKVDPTFATMVRSVVMTVLLLITCTFAGVWSKLPELKGRPLLMIVLSGAAGAASWLFYFRAVQLGDVSKVAPIDKLSMPLAIILAVLILGERPTTVNWLGVALIVAGAFLASMPARA
ncbi:MAG: EamA family transporter [Tepidisphaeraceae bacterium]